MSGKFKLKSLNRAMLCDRINDSMFLMVYTNIYIYIYIARKGPPTSVTRIDLRSASYQLGDLYYHAILPQMHLHQKIVTQ